MISAVFDLKLQKALWTLKNFEGPNHVYRSIHFFSIHRLSSAPSVPSLRPTLRRRLQSSKVQLLRTISLHGFCRVDLPGESARHRNLPAGSTTKTIPRRDSKRSIQKHARRCQRETRLAHLRRLCTGPHRNGSSFVFKRGSGHRPGQYALRSGLHHDRSMSITLPVGTFPQAQGGGEGPYASRSQRLYPLFYRDYRWKSSRRKHSGSHHPRGRCLLCNGPRPICITSASIGSHNAVLSSSHAPAAAFSFAASTLKRSTNQPVCVRTRPLPWSASILPRPTPKDSGVSLTSTPTVPSASCFSPTSLPSQP